jgi:hypothetical protein
MSAEFRQNNRFNQHHYTQNRLSVEKFGPLIQKQISFSCTLFYIQFPPRIFTEKFYYGKYRRSVKRLLYQV